MRAASTINPFNERSRHGWRITAIAAAVALSPLALANDGDGVFTYTANDTGVAALRNANATPTESEIERIFAEWRETDHVFTWETTFSDTANGKLPTGYVLVVNDGPMPKGWVGQLPAIYFDAETDFDNPIVNVFTYNGEDSATSYRFGTPDGGPAEPILSSHPDSSTASFVNRATATDNADGSRTFELEIDADPILAFTSQYSASNEALEVGFAEKIGIWFHPFFKIGPNYDDGFLFDQPGNPGWNIVRDNYGWYDFENLPTDGVVPEPGLATLLAGGLMLTIRRRRA